MCDVVLCRGGRIAEKVEARRGESEQKPGGTPCGQTVECGGQQKAEPLGWSLPRRTARTGTPLGGGQGRWVHRGGGDEGRAPGSQLGGQIFTEAGAKFLEGGPWRSLDAGPPQPSPLRLRLRLRLRFAAGASRRLRGSITSVSIKAHTTTGGKK